MIKAERMNMDKLTVNIEQDEQLAALLICTRFSETYLRSLDSHELNKLYQERVLECG